MLTDKEVADLESEARELHTAINSFDQRRGYRFRPAGHDARQARLAGIHLALRSHRMAKQPATANGEKT